MIETILMFVAMIVMWICLTIMNIAEHIQGFRSLTGRKKQPQYVVRVCIPIEREDIFANVLYTQKDFHVLGVNMQNTRNETILEFIIPKKSKTAFSEAMRSITSDVTEGVIK